MKKYSLGGEIPDLSFHYTHGAYAETHMHDFWEIMIVTEGMLHHKINGQKRELQKDTVCLIRPNDYHSLHTVKNHECNNVNLRVKTKLFKEQADIIDKNLYQRLQRPAFIEFETAPSTTRYVLDIVYRLQFYDKNADAYNHLLSLLFFDFLRCIIHDYILKNTLNTKYPEPVKAILELMYNLKNINSSVAEICKLAGYSHYYVDKLFKKHVNTTPVQLFQNIKLQYARNLLETTDLSVLLVAGRIGINNIGHFNRLFKKTFNAPPGVYRRIWQSNYSSFTEITNPHLT